MSVCVFILAALCVQTSFMVNMGLVFATLASLGFLFVPKFIILKDGKADSVSNPSFGCDALLLVYVCHIIPSCNDMFFRCSDVLEPFS